MRQKAAEEGFVAEIIPMPDLGFEAGEGELSVWLKGVGDAVEAGEAIAEFESDKVMLEVEAPVAGVLLEQLIQPGDSVEAGAPIAKIGGADELSAAPAPGLAQAPTPVAPVTRPEAEARPEPAPIDGEESLAGSAAAEPVENGALATPIALRMAREHSLDLGGVAGSGPGGRILRADVERLLARSEPVKSVAASHPAPETGAPPKADGSAARLRRAIAQRMSESKQTVPHFYITNSVMMDEALELRSKFNDAFKSEGRVTVNDIVMKATALALRGFPNLNASYVDGRVEVHPEIHIGAAVAVEGGVLTVVNRQTDRKSVLDIARENRAMIERARGGRVSPEDVSGGTFTISNLGGYDTDHFAAIINPPQAAILGAATAKETAVVVDGQLAVRRVMQVTISADHRVTDGAECALFLQRVKALLEAPFRLFVT